MFLGIDLSTNNQIRLVLWHAEEQREASFDQPHRQLLNAVDLFLTNQDQDKQGLRGIAVVSETGRFTSTRLAITLANTWGYVLNIPVISVTKEMFEQKDDVLQRFKSKRDFVPVMASYSAEPNIGGAKNKKQITRNK